MRIWALVPPRGKPSTIPRRLDIGARACYLASARIASGASDAPIRAAIPATESFPPHDSRRPRRRRDRSLGRDRDPAPPRRRRDEGLGPRPSLRRVRRPRGDIEPRLRRAAPEGLVGLHHEGQHAASRNPRRAASDAQPGRRCDRGAVLGRGPRPVHAERGRAAATRRRRPHRRARPCARRFSRMADAAVRGELRRRGGRRGQGARRAGAGRPARQSAQNHARPGPGRARSSLASADAALANWPADRHPPRRARAGAQRRADLRQGPGRGAGRRLAARGAAGGGEARHAGPRSMRRRWRQDARARRQYGKPRSDLRDRRRRASARADLRPARTLGRPKRASAQPARAVGRARRSRRPMRSRHGRRAVHRFGRMAAQPRRQMAHPPRRARTTHQ